MLINIIAVNEELRVLDNLPTAEVFGDADVDVNAVAFGDVDYFEVRGWREIIGSATEPKTPA